ncbi:PAS domain-containing protein [Devosia chinhatensis]|uniref:PAS domain-containing protein n=2 Tax=Devosia aurantiaca TaxID=2714858 RepID=A0A6M1SUI8_9HYPH|nr:PAS domain-containing protein [Devosia aurantiaca]
MRIDLPLVPQEISQPIGRSLSLEAAFSSIPDFVYAFDREGRFAYANSSMLALFGLTAEAMLGKTFAGLGYPSDLADRLNGHIRHVLATGEAIDDEVFYRSPTGYAAQFAFRWGPARNADGSIELVVGVSRDTSERHRVEAELKRSERGAAACRDRTGRGGHLFLESANRRALLG